MSIEEKKLLMDVLNAIKGIKFHLGETRNFNIYRQNLTIRRAVERELEIIGEAINNLLKLNPDIQISNARFIVDLRNKVIHAYDSVNDTIIWKVIVKDIPLLENEVEGLLKD